MRQRFRSGTIDGRKYRTVRCSGLQDALPVGEIDDTADGFTLCAAVENQDSIGGMTIGDSAVAQGRVRIAQGQHGTGVVQN